MHVGRYTTSADVQYSQKASLKAHMLPVKHVYKESLSGLGIVAKCTARMEKLPAILNAGGGHC